MNRLRTMLVALVLVGVSRVLADPSLKMASIKPYRAGAGQLAFRIEFEGRPNPARLRIMLDVDGPGHGEPTSGADYMLEGVNFYRYPAGATGWQWEAMPPPLIVTGTNRLVCVLPEVVHIDTARWYAETTDEKWATADRFPKTGTSEFKFADLPPLPAEELRRNVASPALQITGVTPRRVLDGGLAFTVTFAAKPDPARFRLMLETDRSNSREPNTGADHMIEGVGFFSYPAGATNWTWNPGPPPVIVADDKTLTYILPDAPAATSIQWLAETTNPDWTSADRFPPVGKLEFKPSSLPELKLDIRHRPEDVSELTNGPASLSCRFDDEIKTRKWEESAPKTLPARFVLHDAVTGQMAAAEPARAFRSGQAMRWEGTTLGVDWTLVSLGDDWFAGELRSETNRCLRVGVGYALNPVGWTWHDDFRFTRTITSSTDPYSNVSGDQSLYPFGVISSSNRVLVVENDPDEPRVCQIVAETKPEFFGVYYDLALTPATAKFPGKATFRCALRSLPVGEGNPFRRALTAFYQRNPAYEQRRVPAVGLWMPFFDIGTIPHAEDFGFAFFEKEGAAGKDVAYASTNGILTLAYTEPWLYWLPMPGQNRTEAAAIRRMKFYAAAGSDQRSEFAAAALSGAVRKPDGLMRMQFVDVPWNSGARMEVSTDPEFPATPINRAMSEWRHVKQILADERYAGVYLDSMSAMEAVDYNPAAIAVADYPCTFETGVFQPGLSPKVAAYEYTAALGRALQRRGRYLMGNFPCWRFPYFMQWIDIPGEETTWWLGGRYQRLSDAQLIYRRAISGRKPYGFLQAANFDEFKGAPLEQYFQDCMFWGFLPSFFSADGASNPYWTKPEWFERDRPLFKTYIPIIRRLAAAGWQPLGQERSDSENLWVEHFGAPGAAIQHLTLRNAQDTVLTTKLSLGVTNETVVLVNPLDGRCDFIEPTGKVNVTLPGQAIETRDIVPISHLRDEIEFTHLKSLSSLATELAAGIRCTLGMPAAFALGEDNPVTLEIVNRSDTPVTVSDVQLTQADNRPKKIAPGQSATIAGRLRADTNEWREIRWRVNDLVCARVFKPKLVEAIAVAAPVDKLVTIGSETTVELKLQNMTGHPHAVRVRWRGDFGDGDRKEILGANAVEAVRLPVKAGESQRGQITVVVEANDRPVFERRFDVMFLSGDVSLTRDSRVRVEADSTYAGYTTKPVTDGVRETTGVAWNDAAWASDETGGNHWVRITFPAPVTARDVAIYWNVEGGVTYTSQRGNVVGLTETGDAVALGEFTNARSSAVTKIEFEPRKLKAIELRQPAHAGPATRPNLMWLTEVEVH